MSDISEFIDRFNQDIAFFVEYWYLFAFGMMILCVVYCDILAHLNDEEGERTTFQRLIKDSKEIRVWQAVVILLFVPAWFVELLLYGIVKVVGFIIDLSVSLANVKVYKKNDSE